MLGLRLLWAALCLPPLAPPCRPRVPGEQGVVGEGGRPVAVSALPDGPIIIHITSLIIVITIIEAASPATLPAASTIIILQITSLIILILAITIATIVATIARLRTCIRACESLPFGWIHSRRPACRRNAKGPKP